MNYQYNLNLGESTAEIVSMDPTLPLPDLTGVKRLGLDTETSNEPAMRDRSLAGISYYLPDKRQGYLPLRHPETINHSEERLRAWARATLRDKELVVANAKHEADTFYRWGIDLEEQGCTFCDVFHAAALLNDHRHRLNLDLIAREELDRGKLDLKATTGRSVVEWPIHLRPAAMVAAYAIEDATLAWELDQVYHPRIIAEELEQVLDLENNLVYAVNEMERNGTYLDVEMLDRWDAEIMAESQQRLLDITKVVGFQVNPGSWKDMARLFTHLHLEYPYTAPTAAHRGGCPSFGEAFLATVDHPVVRLALEASQLNSLRTKYTSKYRGEVDTDGRLRYQLHQLRGDEYGTITGRFSASNVNIQQVSVQEKQPLLTQRWPIRALFMPAPGTTWVSADASQIEFRLLAHYSALLGMPRLAVAYRTDPRTDFHALIVAWTGLIRGFAKNVSFARLYGGGIPRIAEMCGLSCEEGTRLAFQYDREFPEAKLLLSFAAKRAENVGFVRTFLNRRRRYPPKEGQKFYSALNAVLQGSAADILKRKILELYRHRKQLGLTLRFTVHDEIDGDLADVRALPDVRKILDEQTTALEVPILWDVKIGKTWQEAH